MQIIRHIFSLIALFYVSVFSCAAFMPFSEKNNFAHTALPALLNTYSGKLSSSKDSVDRHRLSLRYPDEKKGIKPWIAPAALIAGGTFLHFSTEVKQNVNDFMKKNLAYQGNLDNYAQFAPLATAYILYFSGIHGKNNFGNKTAVAVKSFLLNDFITYQLKYNINEPRPNEGAHSFPSGHTSKAFAFAHFLHREYGELSPWYSIGAYATATAVGYLRLAKSAHWISDVIAGAGIGILSTELIYLTHQYKWDKEHLKKVDILPFRLGNQKGVTLVYTF